MMHHINFENKTVLDLGCNYGFFSFELSRVAKCVVGVDSDSHAIQENQQRCESLKISNIEFRNDLISSNYINSLPKSEITIFLSVLHHIITASGVYDSNESANSGKEIAIEILRSISERTDVLIFEIGQSNESHHWAKLLPDMSKDQGKWIKEELLYPAGFSNVEVYNPLEGTGVKSSLLRNLYFSSYNDFLSGSSLFSRIFRRLTNYDDRDGRFLFIARKD